MSSKKTAAELQSEIMVLAHTLKTGSYINRDAIKRAADLVAQRHGYGSGLELQQMIGSQTSNLGKPNKQPPPVEQKQDGDSYKARYTRLVEAHDVLPPDAVLNDAWGCADGTLSSIRSELRQQGYEFDKSNGLWKVVKRPSAPVAPVAPVAASNGVVQGSLELVADSSCSDVVKEVRQIRALVAMLLAEQRVSNAKLLAVWTV